MANIVKSVLSPSKPGRAQNDSTDFKRTPEPVEHSTKTTPAPVIRETQAEERLTFDEWAQRVQAMGGGALAPQDRVVPNLPRFNTVDWRECRTLVTGLAQ